MGKFSTSLDQEFHARQIARRNEITRLDKGRYNTAYLFAMSLCSCALGAVVLIYVIAR
ncbi:MAG: hypothetical protein QOF41_2456 [Methylobacteriaceae bacterium]|nr:hypothetical protein [Methylobacteriaceae bacterium]